MVISLKGENAKVISERVKERIAALEKTLPQQITLRPFYDQTEVIDRTTHTLRKNLLEGSLLVIFVLFVFLRDVRAALLVALVIPLAMLTDLSACASGAFSESHVAWRYRLRPDRRRRRGNDGKFHSSSQRAESSRCPRPKYRRPTTAA
jgi:hypothetical protein